MNKLGRYLLLGFSLLGLLSCTDSSTPSTKNNGASASSAVTSNGGASSFTTSSATTLSSSTSSTLSPSSKDKETVIAYLKKHGSYLSGAYALSASKTSTLNGYDYRYDYFFEYNSDKDYFALDLTVAQQRYGKTLTTIDNGSIFKWGNYDQGSFYANIEVSYSWFYSYFGSIVFEKDGEIASCVLKDVDNKIPSSVADASTLNELALNSRGYYNLAVTWLVSFSLPSLR